MSIKKLVTLNISADVWQAFQDNCGAREKSRVVELLIVDWLRGAPAQKSILTDDKGRMYYRACDGCGTNYAHNKFRCCPTCEKISAY